MWLHLNTSVLGLMAIPAQAFKLCKWIMNHKGSVDFSPRLSSLEELLPLSGPPAPPTAPRFTVGLELHYSWHWKPPRGLKPVKHEGFDRMFFSYNEKWIFSVLAEKQRCPFCFINNLAIKKTLEVKCFKGKIYPKMKWNLSLFKRVSASFHWRKMKPKYPRDCRWRFVIRSESVRC